MGYREFIGEHLLLGWLDDWLRVFEVQQVMVEIHIEYIYPDLSLDHLFSLDVASDDFAQLPHGCEFGLLCVEYQLLQILVEYSPC